MTLYINTSDCNGCGGCEELCPKVFVMDEHGEKAVVLEPEADEEPCVDEVIVFCPQNAIIKE
jgi:ferredoxin